MVLAEIKLITFFVVARSSVMKQSTPTNPGTTSGHE